MNIIIDKKINNQKIIEKIIVEGYNTLDTDVLDSCLKPLRCHISNIDNANGLVNITVSPL